MTYIDPMTVCDILSQNIDRILTVKFVKRTNGEPRTLTGRLGVSRYVKGVGMSYTPAQKNLFVIFDLALARTLLPEQRSKAYRCVPVDSMLEIHCGGEVVLP